MNPIRPNLAADINRHHEVASSKAKEAVNHAIEAGKLLLEAKAALPHGEWLGWLEANIRVTPRRCQQYIRYAQGKPMPLRAALSVIEDAPHDATTPPANTKSVSHLKADAPRNFPGEPDTASFVPESSHCYAVVLPDTTLFIVEPSMKHPGYFFVSKMCAATDTVQYTRRPVSASWVEANLRYWGLEKPSAAEWRMMPSAGVLEALGTFPWCAE
jgi:hypothetical protein